MPKEIANASQAPLTTPSAPGEGPTYRHLAQLVGRVMRFASNEVWLDGPPLPREGGMLLVCNHTSAVDVLAVGRYAIWQGRWPRYLGKAEIWKVPGLGWLARQCGQIPVKRGTHQARDSLGPARAALEAGECVAIYPEGGRSRDPELWPMRARTGAARLALDTQVPVIPVVQWGSHRVMPGRKLTFPRVWPKQTIEVKAGAPVDLSDLYGRSDYAAVREASDRIMNAITTMVEELRGETRPDEIWDMQKNKRVPRNPLER